MSHNHQLLGLAEIAELARAPFEEACRAMASPLYLGDGQAICRIVGRYKLYVSTRDDGFAANVLLDGYWESWLTRFMARRVRAGDRVVDVGANYGYYTLLLADLVGPGGRVHAVEPNAEAAELLRRSVLLNGLAARTEIHPLAAGAASGIARLLIPPREPKNAAVLAAASSAPAGAVCHDVPVASLDALLADAGPIDFLKIDAEGAEEAIIEGMGGILAARPAMVLEFNTARYADPGAFLERLLRVYGSLRYVDYEGHAAPVAPERVLSEHPGEDWLLFLGGR